jgi:hypothetical protein
MALLPRMLSELPLPAESRGIIVELQNLAQAIQGAVQRCESSRDWAPAPEVPIHRKVDESANAISVTSSVAAAEIEVDGAFVGNTSTVQLSPGWIALHRRGARRQDVAADPSSE